VALCGVLLAGSLTEGNEGHRSAGIRERVTRSGQGPAGTGPPSRPFYMGMSPGAYDLTDQAVEDTYRFLGAHADLVAHHLGQGVPWPEALEKRPYHPNVEKELRVRMRHLTSTQRTYVAIQLATEGGLTGYWGKDEQMERPGKWKEKAIDDPEVVTAYLNYARDLIARFHPDFFNYAIEANMLAKNKTGWPQFVNAARRIYTTLKSEHPRLPVFFSIQIDEHWKDPNRQRDSLRQVLAYTDFIAVSLYPYIYGYFDPHTIPRGYLPDIAALAPEKPFAVAETGFIARDLDALGLKGPGSERWQNDYLRFLLEESNRRNARFVIWFVPIDYDRVWNKIKIFAILNKGVEVFKLWVHCGLMDDQLRPRPSLATWTEWFRSPRR
jgi:hypothetical protein